MAHALKTTTTDHWPLPPEPYTANGEMRRVGMEFEFAGLSVERAVEVILRLWPGTPRFEGSHAASVETEAHGAFQVELDTRHTKPHEGDSEVVSKIRELFGDAASAVVPVEITCPPVPLDRAHLLDALPCALAAAGAEGTHAAPLYAFGLHLNIELERTDIANILDRHRAYVLLEDWLRAEIEIDPSRRVLAFEQSFPVEWQRTILDPSYAPTTQEFVEDYLRLSPTRNRGVDMLPILAHLSPDTVSATLPNEKIKPRPTWHYRLPNSGIGEDDWSPRRDWERWLRIERLAANPELLSEAMAARLDILKRGLPMAGSSRTARQTALELGEKL